MTETGTIAVVAAMWQEIEGLRNRMQIEEIVWRDGPQLLCGRYEGREVVLAQTGPGRRQAEAVTRFLLDCYPAAGLVSLGFAGALDRELRPGDIVLCRELLCGDDGVSSAPRGSSEAWLRLASRLSGRGRSRVLMGNCVTVGRLAAGRQEKEELSCRFGAGAVDMESYWMARLAAAREIPFLAVRAISDTREQSLPPFDRFFGRGGEWLLDRAVLHFLTHPAHLATLPALYRNVRRAEAGLSGLVGSFLALESAE